MNMRVPPAVWQSGARGWALGYAAGSSRRTPRLRKIRLTVLSLMAYRSASSRFVVPAWNSDTNRHTSASPSRSMQRELSTVGVDQDVRIDCDHDTARRCSTRSRYSSTAALLSMSTVGIRLPCVTGRSTGTGPATVTPAGSAPPESGERGHPIGASATDGTVVVSETYD